MPYMTLTKLPHAFMPSFAFYYLRASLRAELRSIDVSVYSPDELEGEEAHVPSEFSS